MKNIDPSSSPNRSPSFGPKADCEGTIWVYFVFHRQLAGSHVHKLDSRTEGHCNAPPRRTNTTTQEQMQQTIMEPCLVSLQPSTYIVVRGVHATSQAAWRAQMSIPRNPMAPCRISPRGLQVLSRAMRKHSIPSALGRCRAGMRCTPKSREPKPHAIP